jgi:hypothetical protein
MSYQAFILLPSDTDVSLEEVRRILEDYYSDDARDVDFKETENKLTVTIDDWRLSVNLNSKPSVIVESKEMAEAFAGGRADQNEIASSGVRLEISGGDDDEMDYFNDYVEILEQLEDFKGAKVWEGAQSAFIN